jgi:tetratricopeptide (TPR) repeat protein
VKKQGSRGAEEHQEKGFSKSPISNLQSPIVWGKLLARQGWFTFQLGQHELAETLLVQGLDLLRQAGSTALRETIFPLNYLGAVYRHLGQYEPAQKYLQESLAVCRETGDTFGLTVALNILGQVAYLQGDYPEAQRLCQESLGLKQKLGDRRGATFSFIYLGQVAHTLGEYPAAKAYFEESLAICQEIGDRRGIALCLGYLGDVVQMMGEDQGARQLYEESLAIFKEIGNQWGVISAQTKLGAVAGKLGDSLTARTYLKEALKLALNIHAIPLVMDALVGWAALLIKGGQTEQALEILTLTLSHSASSRENQDRAARLLAELEPQLPKEAGKVKQTRDRTSTLEMMVKRVLGEGKG